MSVKVSCTAVLASWIRNKVAAHPL